VVGHLHQIARAGLIGHLLNVSREFPEGIFKLKFGSRIGVFVTDPDLVAILSDETRFRKMPGQGPPHPAAGVQPAGDARLFRHDR
jgi:cytochrome P450/NADPH-cytochrome P450 reductase